ncbi:MAG: response regulator [Cyanobacteria bacterium P01_F01_bin.42]
MTSSSVKILVVDDHQPTLRNWKQILQENHFSVLTANHGQEAYDLACQQHPNLIVSDIDMPEVDGFELLTRLKQTQSTQSIPVVICSGTSDQTSEYLAFSLGAIAYFKKPLCPSDLIEIVSERCLSAPLV